MSDQFVKRIRKALVASKARRYTVAEILACGCEPEIEHCSHCDSLRQANARCEEPIRVVEAPGNVKALLDIIEKTSARSA